MGDSNHALAMSGHISFTTTAIDTGACGERAGNDDDVELEYEIFEEDWGAIIIEEEV